MSLSAGALFAQHYPGHNGVAHTHRVSDVYQVSLNEASLRGRACTTRRVFAAAALGCGAG